MEKLAKERLAKEYRRRPMVHAYILPGTGKESKKEDAPERHSRTGRDGRSSWDGDGPRDETHPSGFRTRAVVSYLESERRIAL